MIPIAAESKVRVGLGSRAYDITVKPGSLSECGRPIAGVLPPPRKLAVITNDKISELYGNTVRAGLEAAGFEVSFLEVSEGERYKSLESAGMLYGRLLELGADRTSALIALGGGVIGDLTGFVAATYMRGIAFVQIPTSLLAQVDSSVGGKTAVNHPLAKNIIGAFYQPRLVLIDPEVLSTLPPREFRAGLSEIVKYGLIAGEPLLGQVRAGLPFRDDPAALVPIIIASCTYKAGIVEQDEFDSGVRAVLNYGHTIGHALEAVAGYRRYNHGEAVAVGMIGAALIGERLGMLDPREVEIHRELIEAAGLPSAIDKVDPEAVIDHLSLDKKRVGGRDRLVLLNGLGRPEVREVEGELIREAIVRLVV
jgi:3-dehydroquinate synthase